VTDTGSALTFTGRISLPTEMDLSGLQWQDRSQCYQPAGAEHFYTAANSSIWQMFDESPDWVHAMALLIPGGHDHHVVSVIRVDPGQTIPLHQDRHWILQQTFGSGETWRYLIFLEDWQSGHYFEINGRPLLGWRQGDFLKFHRSEWHLGGNMGIQPFYSAQITVLYLDKSTK